MTTQKLTAVGVSCFIMRTQRTNDPISLPLDAFRVTMLSGTLAPQSKAGFNNIPPNSQAIATHATKLHCVGVIPRIDYVTYLSTVPNLHAYISEVEQRLGLVFDCIDKTEKLIGVKHWSLLHGSRGATIAYSAGEGTSTKVRLNLGGRACNGVSLGIFCEFLEWVSRLSDSHPTRFDYNADDITGLLSLPTIASHLREGGYKGYVCGEVIESVGGSNSGVSVYFGGRKSLQRVVFYDKAAESGDENAGIRHEVRCRGGRAVEMVELIRGKNYEEVCEILRGKLRGSISLGARRGKNLDRFVVAEFWKNWEDMLLSTPIEKQPLPRKSSITRSIAWIVKQVSKTVAKINTSIPCEYIDEFWLRIEKLGMDRIKDSDYGNIADYSREFSEDELWRMFPIC